MYPRLCNPLLSRSFFLFGARGTGKTKLLKGIFQDQNVEWIDLLKEGEIYTFSKNPSELSERLKARKDRPSWVIVDEVQRVPQLLNEVHRAIEETGLKFALTGSSARKLKRGAANLLGGRALLNHLHPLTSWELKEDFILSSALNWGTLPALVNEHDELTRSELLKSYIEVYLREEIREEQIVRRLDPFARFLEVSAQSSGTIINYSRIGREAGTDAKTILRYFQILEETLLGFFLEPYHISLRKRQRQQAKFYLFDLGVKRALEGALRIPLREQTYEWGKMFEHFVVLEFMRLNSYLRADYQFSYLKTQSQLEIDLIAERKGDRAWVFEIKATSEPDPVDIKKLKELAELFPNSRACILCTTTIPRIVDGIEIMHWSDGLKKVFEG